MRLLKIASWIVGLLVLLVVGAVIAIPLIFEPNDFKPEIAELVEEETGRKITIEGDIGLSVFPWLAVELGKTQFANAEGFGSEPMAEIESSSVRVKLLPLLKKQIQIGTVKLEGLTLRLALDENGRANWQDILDKQASNQGEKKPPAEEEKSGEFDMSTLSIAGLQLKNSQVYWQDKQAGTSQKAENINLTTGALVMGEPLDLELSFTADSSEPAVQGEFAVEGRLKYDLEAQQYAATGLQLNVKANGAGIPVALEAFELSGDVAADMTTQQFTASNLKFEGEGSGNKGGSVPLSAFSFEGAGSVKANLESQLVNVAGLLLKADGKGNAEFPLARFKAEVTGDLNASPEAQQLSSENLKVSVEGTGQGELPLRDFTAALTGLLDIDMQGQTLSFSDAKITAKGDGTKDGPAQKFDATFSGDVSANLAEQLYSITGLKLKANAEGKTLPGEKVDASLTGSINANLKQQNASLDDFVLSAMGLQAKGQLSALQITSTPQFAGVITTEAFNPRAIASQLNIELPPMADPAVMQKAGFRTQVSGDQNNVVLKNLELVLDDTRATGEVIVSNFSDPRIGFNLAVDQFDADRYLPPVEEAKEGESESERQERELNQTPVDLSFLEPLNIEGNARVGQLKVNNLELSDVTLGLKADKGDVLLSPLALNLYGGSLQGNVAVNVRDGKQTISAKQTLQNLQFEPFTRALMDDAKVAGSGNVKLDITTAGTTVGALRKALNGTVDVEVDNGAVLGFNIAQFLRTAKAKFSGDSAALATANETRQTDFAKISASANIVNGVLSNPDLLGMSPALRLLGEGNINLVAETLDYKTSITIVETSKGQGGDGLDDLRGISIPVAIGGTFSDPKIKLDMKEILKAALAARYQVDLDAKKAELQAKLEVEKQRLQERKDAEKAKLEAKLADEKRRLKDKLNDKVGSELGGMLGSLGGKNSEDEPDKVDEGADSLEEKASKELERGFKKLFGR